MNTWHYHADPPRTLAERLRQLNDNLKALGERLKSSIASVIGSTIADAVKDAVSKLLSAEEAQPLDYRYDRPAPSRWDDRIGVGQKPGQFVGQNVGLVPPEHGFATSSLPL
jgi:hypothetical protein